MPIIVHFEQERAPVPIVPRCDQHQMKATQKIADINLSRFNIIYNLGINLV